MKLDKRNVTRRVDLLAAEGVTFRTGVNVGVDISGDDLRREFDAVLLACGALKARELDIPGRDLRGVHLAMDYLTTTTKHLLDSGDAAGAPIDARDRLVIVIGGGDTGADCIGTALRQGCRSIVNITRREREPDFRDDDHPWPGPPGTYYLDYSHAEGHARFGRDPREYGILPLEFVPAEPTSAGGRTQARVGAVRIERLAWDKRAGRWESTRTGIVEDLPADLVFLAIGFTGHDTPRIVAQLGVSENRGIICADYGRFETSVPGVFAAGDMRRGASLIVWAIAEGRGAARAIDQYLMGDSTLPAPDAALLSSAG